MAPINNLLIMSLTLYFLIATQVVRVHTVGSIVMGMSHVTQIKSFLFP